jgi:hypothetical protein
MAPSMFEIPDGDDFHTITVEQLDQPAHQDAIVCAIEDAAVSDDLPWFTYFKNYKLHRSLIRHLLKIRRPLKKKMETVRIFRINGSSNWK